MKGIPGMILAGVLLAGGAAAADPQAATRGVKGTDDRVSVGAAAFPWSAIGRLTRGDGTVCSGAVIAPALVLTAAHCLWLNDHRTWIQATAITFHAGAEEGRAVAISPATGYEVAPDYAGPEDHSLANSARDWALVRLADPIGERTGMLGLLPLDEASAARLAERRAVVIHTGYPIDRPYRQSAHVGCHVTGWATPGLVAHDCDATRGASGSPLLVWDPGETPEDGAFRIIALHVSSYRRGTDSVRGGAVAGSRIVPAASRRGATPLGDLAAADLPRREVWGVLDLLGYAPGARGLPDAIRAFQAEAGMTVNGEPTPAVLGEAMLHLR